MDAAVAAGVSAGFRFAVGALAVCSRCGGPISPRERWHLDHTDDRRGYIGVAHAYCNLRAAGIKTAQLRNPDRALRWSRVWFEPIPPGTQVGDVVYGLEKRSF
jgi:hypothetical protein